MEVQGKGAGRTWLDWWRPKQEAGEAVHPASQDNAENIDETVPEDEPLALGKLDGRRVGVTAPLLAAISLILLSGVLFLVSRKREFALRDSPKLSSSTLNSHNEWTPLTASDDILQSSLHDLSEAQGVMMMTWSSSGGHIRKAFLKHFAPPLDDGHALPGYPLTTIKDHVSKMQDCEFPFDSAAELRTDFLHHVQLLTTICRMVTLRLRELACLQDMKGESVGYRPILDINESDSNSDSEGTSSAPASMQADDALYAEGMVGSEQRQPADGEAAGGSDLEDTPSDPFLDDTPSDRFMEEPDRNPGGEGTDADWLLHADDFLRAMQMAGSARGQSVPIRLGGQLMFQLSLEDTYNISNIEVQEYFEQFLQPSGGEDAVKATPSSAKHQIPYNKEPFRTGTLAKAAAQIFRQNEDSTKYSRIRKIHELAGNWTTEGVKMATKRQKEENAYKFEQRLLIKREQRRVFLKKGIQNNDLEMIALFLL